MSHGRFGCPFTMMDFVPIIYAPGKLRKKNGGGTGTLSCFSNKKTEHLKHTTNGWSPIKGGFKKAIPKFGCIG